MWDILTVRLHQEVIGSWTCQPHLDPCWGWKPRPPRRHEEELRAHTARPLTPAARAVCCVPSAVLQCARPLSSVSPPGLA